MAVNPWVNFENMSLNDQAQNLNVPVFSQNDFLWTANPTYDPNSRGGQMEYRQYGDTYGSYEWVDDGTLKKGSWGWSPEAEARLKAGGWDTSNPNNIAWNSGDLTSGVHGGGIVNDDPNANWYDLVKNVTMKNSRSTGLGFSYQHDPNTGALVPVYTGGSDYITNSGESNRKALAAFAGLVGAGFAIPAAAAALGTGAGGAVGGGMTAAEGAALGAEAGGLSVEGAAAAQQASSLSQALQYANYGSKALQYGGQLTGNEALSNLGKYGGMATGFTGGLDNLYSGVTGGNWMDALKGAYSTYGAGNRVYNSLTQEAPIGSPRRTRSPNMTQEPGLDPQISSPRNWIDQIFGIGAGVQSDVQNRESFKNLNDLFSRREQARAPFEQALTQSYADGGKSFLSGDVYQAQRMLEQNKLDRGAAKAGRLANDYDRDVGMQAHALKALENYRGGLRDSLAQQQLPYEIFRDAQIRNARAGAGTAGGVGYSGATSGLAGIIQQALGGSGSPQMIQEILRRISGGSAAPESPSDPYGPPVPRVIEHGGSWGVTDPGHDVWNLPTTPDDYYGVDFNDPSVWEDTGWMNAIDGWFDA